MSLTLSSAVGASWTTAHQFYGHPARRSKQASNRSSASRAWRLSSAVRARLDHPGHQFYGHRAGGFFEAGTPSGASPSLALVPPPCWRAGLSRPPAVAATEPPVSDQHPEQRLPGPALALRRRGGWTTPAQFYGHRAGGFFSQHPEQRLASTWRLSSAVGASWTMPPTSRPAPRPWVWTIQHPSKAARAWRLSSAVGSSWAMA